MNQSGQHRQNDLTRLQMAVVLVISAAIVASLSLIGFANYSWEAREYLIPICAVLAVLVVAIRIILYGISVLWQFARRGFRVPELDLVLPQTSIAAVRSPSARGIG